MDRMISTADLDRVLALMQQHGIRSLTLREGSTRLSLTRSDCTEARTKLVEHLVRAKGIGSFRPSHPRRSEPAAQPGDRVEATTIVGFLQAGSLLVPVVAGRAGRVQQLHVEAGSLVGYGDPILTLLAES
jgi:acetyl-CoA carboxylase biotin carboxyl carrier protein